MIAIIDYDVGNVGAVANMLRRLGFACEITAAVSAIESATKLILPGNGAFDACMRNLRSSGLIPLLERRVFHDRVPLLGICVGAQLLGSGSEEGVEAGLGWLDMAVRRFPNLPELPVPHMGWTEVRSSGKHHNIIHDLEPESRYYFVHSYYMEPSSQTDVLLLANYGFEFAAAVAHQNLIGVQFHPEKSHRFGKRLLGNFAGLA